MVRALSLISLGLTLSACGAAKQDVRVEFLPIPPALLQCKAEPRAPDPATATDSDVAKWEIGLMAAGCDCRDKVASIRALSRGERPPATSCP
jgi:hypothetical protein